MFSQKSSKKTWIKTIFQLFIFLTILQGYSQEIRIELARKKIKQNEFLQIRVLSNYEDFKGAEGFPEIKDFEKTFQVSLEYTSDKGEIWKGIEQNYKPLKVGKFKINPFEIKVGTKKQTFKGEEVWVEESPENTETDLLSQLEEESQAEDLVGLGKLQNVFVALTANTKEVFVGEEINLNFALYVAKNAPIALDLYDLDRQISQIVRQIHLPKSWQENYGLDSVSTDEIILEKKTYKRYKFFQSAFYPTEPLLWNIPSLELKVLDKEKEKLLSLRSNPLSILIKPLPKNIKNLTGRLQMQEIITYLKIQTGQSVNYQINIVGNANFARLNLPPPNSNNFLEFYATATEQTLRKMPSQIIGVKSFRYTILAKKPGKYPLKNYFFLAYFNQETKKIDTLRSKLVLEVSGSPLEFSSLENSELQSWIEKADDTPMQMRTYSRTRWIATGLLALLFLIVLYKVLSNFRE
jgi:hypothetical protein